MERRRHKIIELERLKRVLTEIFTKHNEILLCYLYGSYVGGTRTEFSDIDIGILLDRNYEKSYLYQIDLSLEIEKAFNNEIEVDIVILDETTPRFLFNVLKNGYCIYFVNETLKHEFEIVSIHDYLDVKPMLDMYDRMTIKGAIDD